MVKGMLDTCLPQPMFAKVRIEPAAIITRELTTRNRMGERSGADEV
jgi:hypothetical protein